MAALIFDIESAGEDWTKIDEHTKKLLVERITRWHPEIEEETAMESAQNDLGFSPFTGEIVALGVLDSDTDKGAVYFQDNGKKVPDKEIDGVKLTAYSEKEMLLKFWELTDRYTEFVSFSGRNFDIPFIMLRSAIHGIRPKKDLMRGRYLYQQSPQAIHIDLYDQLKFYGAITHIGGLHLACRAFGIETPKDGEIDGSQITEYFRAGKIQQIAEYNARDLHATRLLYKKWKELLAF
ncbi:MAG TPA: ribonuclease H-like domain-containing protein [Candidatus Saccharimonadales bacterium]|nr:ribonuclease H-like domain-containing protein [Candidatus Saccharimonadales bacterium]